MAEMNETIRERGLKGRNVKNRRGFDDDFFDKENEHGAANFITIKKGLRTGLIGYENLKFSSKLLEKIDMNQWNDENFIQPKKDLEPAEYSCRRADVHGRRSDSVRRYH